MTDEQINIAIAGACGWQIGPRTQYDMVVLEPNGRIQLQIYALGRSSGELLTIASSYLPNYCNDLNAMHEAERFLSFAQWDIYCELLGESLQSCAHATARQRAEAFLRTLGKWEESN